MENISALFETVLLLVTSVWSVYEAVERLLGKSVEVEASVWAFVVMGVGAPMRLQAANVHVFLAEHATVQDAMTAFRAGHLREVTPATACGGHGSGQHGHGPNGSCHGN